jgi:hypothetical protein
MAEYPASSAGCSAHMEMRTSPVEEVFPRLYILSVVPVKVTLNRVEIATSGGLGDCIAINSDTRFIVHERYQYVAVNSYIAHRKTVRGHGRRVINRPVNGRIVIITNWDTENIVDTILAGHALSARRVTGRQVVG